MKEELPVIIDYTPKSLSYKGKKFMRKIPSLLKIYLISIFPIIQWIHRYNTTWLVQDMIAGITVGIVIVPQSMAYAKVANLDPQYGLYSSFVGSTLYCFFGTSKDISVGPISTVSLLISTAVNSVINANPNITPAEVAVSLGLHAGIISIVISLLRLGILVDFIPEPAIAGYMTGSAITIVISQWPKLFGIPDVSTHASPYMIFGQFFAKISHTHIDVAFGLSSLVFLYSVRYICVKIKPQSRILQKFVFLFGIMRNGLIVIVGTIISFLINMGRDDSLFSIIKTVPAGFDAMAVPRLHLDIFKKAGGIIPSIVLILVLEHISVAKSFGRICDYQIDPDQEILAIGMSNVIGSFFGGFPSTGAFSRTAIMARSGSRTPMAGVFSGAVVLLALYALTPAFYYIPDAVLAAVVIHAVSDLVSGSKYLKQLWHSNPIEIAVWAGAVIVTIFIDVQAGIYTAVGLSLIVMLYKMARPAVTVLSRVPSIQGPNKSGTMALETDENYFYVNEMDSNFQDNLVKLPKGILVLKLSDSIIYPNAEYISDKIVHIVKQRTR
ncbi:sulfate transporter family-domain-containing protein, partial [Gilbertella persicaria]|uniref:sulfate transporter family-domain-containing protein n=1 Tax=Gilbertella persicaria TaxID=101096 RepID=UPI00221EA4F3